MVLTDWNSKNKFQRISFYYFTDLSSFSHYVEYSNYRTRAIIGRSRFEAALVYKPQILGFKKESRINVRSAS